MKYTIPFFLLIFIFACSTQKTADDATTESEEIEGQEFIPADNPPAEGFNGPGSSPIAVIIADKVMRAMGGRQAWDETQYITWNFFGSRKWLWDKMSGNVRVESLRDDRIVLMNINEMTGKVFKDGAELTEPDSVSKYLEWGKRVWINDSYWLVMPFKLKDSGVTLTYVGESQTLTGELAEKLRLTFEGVGVTPQNAYDVWVSSETSLIKQWAYYPEAADEVPRWIYPWDNYFETGGIMLSDGRGDNSLTDVAVLASVPDGVFSSFDASL